MKRKLKILLSAYACEPGKGSEPGVGWNMAIRLADHHEVWVLTRSNNAHPIHHALSDRPVASLHFAYYDLPRWLSFWKRGGRGIQLYYYLWQLGAAGVARRLHGRVGFDVVHHVTFVKYWHPSLCRTLPVPFLWGPVAGGEEGPAAFLADMSFRGRAYERVRSIARWFGDHDPLVRATARRSAVALGTTPETTRRLRAVGARDARVQHTIALSREELSTLGRLALPASGPLRFLSSGRFLHWKGFSLGLRAFAAADLPGTEYWLAGDGPASARLRGLVRELGLEDRVKFLGSLPREAALEKLAEAHVLVHPSLHDSGGFVCLEAMAAGRPVICLDLGGPGRHVTDSTGVRIEATTPQATIRQMAAAMHRLEEDPSLRRRMGEAGRQRVRDVYPWEENVRMISGLYEQLSVRREILQVHNFYRQPGGEDQVAANEAALLEERGHVVRRYTRHNDQVAEMRGPALAARTVWNRDVHRELRALMRRERPDVTHFHNTFPLVSPAAYYAAADAGVPVVQTLHNYRLVCPGATLFRDGRVCEDCLHRAAAWPAVVHACYRDSRTASAVSASMLAFHRLLRTWSRKIDVFIALTEFARTKLLEGGLPASRVVVKPNFVAPDPGPGGREGGYAVYIGRLSREKGIRTLIEAWRAWDGDTGLVILGDGPLGDEVRRAAESDPRIDWKGHLSRQEAAALVAAAGFVVFPSVWYEGFPMVIGEAFAAGIPVICSDLGSAASIVEDGRAGLHFRAGDPADLVRVIRWSTSHPEAMSAMSARARALFETRYNAAKNYEMLEAIYRRAVDSRGRKPESSAKAGPDALE